jgi:choline kinase
MGKLKNENYNIVILAAGIGSRFGNTINKPKCLLKINNKTIIQILIENLILVGIKRINIVIGFKKEEIINHLSKIRNIEINYIHNKNYKRFGSGYSWYQSLRKIDLKNSFFLFHADIVLDKNYIKFIFNSKKKNLILQTSFNESKLQDNSLVLESSTKNLITGIGYKKYFPESNHEIVCINKFSSATIINFYHFLKDYFKYKKNREKTWELIINDFIREKNVKIYHQGLAKKKWYNINTLDDYIRAKNSKLVLT